MDVNCFTDKEIEDLKALLLTKANDASKKTILKSGTDKEERERQTDRSPIRA